MGSLLERVPGEIADRVRLIDLADESRAPGINLLDTRVFADRDRTADSVVRVCKGLWDQWGPRMQSIVEQTVKSLHEANSHPSMKRGEQYTILDGLRVLSDEKFRARVLGKVNDAYLLEWWATTFAKWTRNYTEDSPLAPVQTRLSYYSTSKRARAILGQSESTIDLREVIAEGGVLLVSTSQGKAGRDVSALAVFQVAAADARQLVWELDRDRVDEEDVTSLPVFHCYVRATVDGERHPTFSVEVREPESGDPAMAARILEDASSYTTPAGRAGFEGSGGGPARGGVQAGDG